MTADTSPSCSEVHPLPSLSLWFQTEGSHGTHRNWWVLWTEETARNTWSRVGGGLQEGKSCTGPRE